MITKAALLRVAELARLQLTDAEIESFTDSLTQILANFEEITQLNTENIAPLVTPSPLTMTLREDVATHESLVEKFMAIAPEKSGNLYKVPPVV